MDKDMDNQLKMEEEEETKPDDSLEQEKLKKKMDEAGIGVLHCCYGEFRCVDCGHFWISSKAWRHFGQQCMKCSFVDNYPFNVEKSYYYCCAECAQIWTHKWDNLGRRCRFCQHVKHAKTYEQFKTYWRAQGWEGMSSSYWELRFLLNHDSNFCEKCKLLGGHYKCTDTFVIDDNGEIQINGRPVHYRRMLKQCSESEVKSITPSNPWMPWKVVRNYRRPQAQSSDADHHNVSRN